MTKRSQDPSCLRYWSGKQPDKKKIKALPIQSNFHSKLLARPWHNHHHEWNHGNHKDFNGATFLQLGALATHNRLWQQAALNDDITESRFLITTTDHVAARSNLHPHASMITFLSHYTGVHVQKCQRFENIHHFYVLSHDRMKNQFCE